MNPYVLFSKGTCVMSDSVADTIRLPITKRVTRPTKIVNTTNRTSAMIRYSGVNICLCKNSGSMKSVTQVKIPRRMSTEAATGTTTSKPAKKEFRRFLSVSFMSPPS